MINYGTAPATDEIEICLFGPGYGEAIAIHLGDGAWLLVDSCIDPNSKKPASATYLDSIGVSQSQVHGILATHWHDDHVKGISDLVIKYPAANFFLSAVFDQDEASAFLATYGGDAANGLSRGAKELFKVTGTVSTCSAVLHRSIVFEKKLNGNNVRVTALSPMTASLTQSAANFAKYLPGNNDPVNNAPPEVKPNIEAVVLHLDFGNDAILLGADLEDHGDGGWTAVASDNWTKERTPASAYKVAHHGSYTGHCDLVWKNLLRPNPIACLTPFNLGSVHLPTEIDKDRLRASTHATYLSSGSSRKPEMSNSKLKRLGAICETLQKVDSGFGAIRLRRKVNQDTWCVDLFGAAKQI